MVGVLPLENIHGTADGFPNSILYQGSDLDMASHPYLGDPAFVVKVWRWHLVTGIQQQYTPGGSSQFTMLDAGFLGHGRGYVIIAKQDFVLDQCMPGGRQ